MDLDVITNESASEKNKKNKNPHIALLIVMTVLISSIFGSIFGFMAGGIVEKIAPSLFKQFPSALSLKPSPDVVKETVVQEDSAVIDVVEKTTPAVVSVIISKDIPKVQDSFSNPFNLPDFFGTPFEQGPGQGNGSTGQGGTQKQQIGGGSGFFITNDGMIVTNRHVVEDTTADYSVLTNDGQEHKATVLARDLVNDIAVIKIDGNDYPTLNLGDSDSLKIGQTVIAIGNSLGEFTNTVSRGIVSGLKRDLTASGGLGQSEKLTNIIQTDAAINPGNSGGPLLDINGNVIGINVAIAQGAQNIGFALPSNQIKKVIDQVKTTGKISTPYIGVRYIPLDGIIQQENGLPYNYGVLVSRGQKITDFAVIPGSPADKAGIVENDILLEVSGTKIDSANGLGNLISKYNVGDTIPIKIWHKGAEKTVDVTLAERI